MQAERERECDPINPYLFATLARNALVVGMCACAATAAVALSVRFAQGPALHTALVLLIALLVAADTLYVQQRNRNLGILTKDWLLLNASRWAFVILALKAASYIGRDPTLVLSQLPAWRVNPLLFIWDGLFILSVAVVLIVWAVARTLGDDLAHLTEGEQVMTTEPLLGAQTDRAYTRQRLVTHVFTIGALIAVLGSLANADILLLDTAIPYFAIGLDLLVYFVLGLALIGLSQLTVLRAGWLYEHTAISGNLVKRWTVLMLAFIGGLAVCTLIVPIGLAAGALPTVAQLLEWLVRALQVVGSWALALLSVLLYPFAWLLSQLQPQNPLPAMPPAVPPPAPVTPEEAPVPPPPWVELAQSLIFWAIILIVIGYVFRYVLRQHEGLRTALSQLPVVVWLRAGWHGFLDALRGIKAELVRIQPRPSPAEQVTTADAVDADKEEALDARHLPLREQLRLLYVNLLERASKRGHVRRVGETPYEFAQTLAQVAPEAQAEINALTQAFVESRYSQHDVPPEQVSWAERAIVRIKRLL